MKKEKNNFQPGNQFQHFFISRMNELVNTETFDSWFIRSSNVLSILKEISEVIKVSRKRESYVKNLEWLIPELKKKIALDIVVSSKYRESSYLVEKMLEIINGSEPYDHKCNEIERLKNIFESYFDRYFENIEKRILSICKIQPDKKYKIETYNLLLEYFTCIKTIGYSIVYLGEVIKEIFSTDGDFFEKVKNITELFDGKGKEFSCKFILQIGHVSSFNRFDNVIIRQPNEGDLAEFNIAGGGGQSVCEITDIIAKDCYSAYLFGRNKVEEIISFQTIYRHRKKSAVMHGKCFVKYSSGLVKDVRFDDFLQNNIICEASHAGQKMGEGFSSLNKLNEADRERIKSSIEYHKTAMTSHSNEMTLLNLWIALETLLVDGDPSIIGKISEIVPALSSLSYAKLTMYSFCKTANMIWRKSPITKEIYSGSDVNVEFLDARWILKAMIEKGDDSANLKKILSYNPLVLYRYDRLENGMFRNKKEHKKCIENNFNNIKWQIHRIYRARNSITHRGELIDNIDQIISNLHKYYHECLGSILHDIGKNNSKTISGSIYHRELARKKYISDLSKDQKKFKISQILNPYRYLFDRDIDEEFSWT